LIGAQSLQRENINSKDSEGKSPIIIAIEQKNVNFLSIVSSSTSIFIQNDEIFTKAIIASFKDASIEWKVLLLKFISSNLRHLSEHQKSLLLKRNKQIINELIDLVYICQDMDSEDDDLVLPSYASNGENIIK
jgi:hypothetical protein